MHKVSIYVVQIIIKSIQNTNVNFLIYQYRRLLFTYKICFFINGYILGDNENQNRIA